MKPTASALLAVLTVVLLLPGLALADGPAALTATDGAALVNVELSNVTVQEAIAKLFQGRTESYILAPGVGGRVTELKLKGITLQQAVQALTDAAGLRYEVEAGAYMIAPKLQPTTTVTMTTAPAEPQAQPVVPSAGGPEQVYQPPPAQTVVYDQPTPVYYGEPAMQYPSSSFGGPYIPPIYQVGNAQIMPGWPPIVITGAGPTTVGWRVAPMIPQVLTPDQMKFWSYVNAVQPQFYFGPSSGPMW